MSFWTRYESGVQMEEIQGQACKFSRVGNGRNESGKIVSNEGERFVTGDEEDGDLKRVGGVVDGGANRLRGWHHSSRIIRVSRASGGKDRHSKVWTSKGLRDRRVRLSVTTAIQFYDLQDRLGYDQPSKAVEWLIKKADDAIAELPSLNNPFPDISNQQSDEKRGNAETEHRFDSVDVELDGEPNYQQNQSQHLSLSKSACSSTSENSKGSNLSLSKPDNRVQRVKARERAKERTAEEKKQEKKKNSSIAHHQNVNPISQNASFTELLTCGIGNVNNNDTTGAAVTTSPSSSIHQNQPGDHDANLFHKAVRQWPSAPLDYFSTGLLGPSSSRTHQSSGFSGLGNSLAQTLSVSPYIVNAVENQSDQLQHFTLIPDHLIPLVSSQPSGGEYNLSFSISSSCLAGFNRGTLQSNSPPFLPHVQKYPPLDGSNVPYFIGAASPSMDNTHHAQFPPGFDARLQLYYGDGGGRHSAQKGKGKN